MKVETPSGAKVYQLRKGEWLRAPDNRCATSVESAHWPLAGGLRQWTMMRHCKALAAVSAACSRYRAPALPKTSWRSPARRLLLPKAARPVAAIVSPIWHDEEERDAAGEPDQLIRLLGIKSGMTVADIGAGSGYYVVRLSPSVGADGRFLSRKTLCRYICGGLRERVRGIVGLQNVTIGLGEPHDPRLPPDAARRCNPGSHVS